MHEELACCVICNPKGKIYMKTILAIAIVLASAGAAFAHGGGLDSARCHMDHKTGIYHCH
jgi:hypothetical protein